MPLKIVMRACPIAFSLSVESLSILQSALFCGREILVASLLAESFDRLNSSYLEMA